MPVPKRKRSRSRRDKRFANKGIKTLTMAECQNCQSPITPHSICEICGHYRGKKVMVTKMERSMKRDEHRKAKAQLEKGGTSSKGEK